MPEVMGETFEIRATRYAGHHVMSSSLKARFAYLTNAYHRHECFHGSITANSYCIHVGDAVKTWA